MSEENKPTQADVQEASEAPAEKVTGDEATAALQLELENTRAKAEEHWNQLLRTQAEMENTRRRAERDVENAHKYALERFAQELLPVKDSLELGLAAISGDDETIVRLKEGSELTLKMLTSVMEKFGIKAVDPLGEPFNPDLHQAISMQPSTEYGPNTVMSVMQKGYLLNDRLIRPALVVVAKAPE